MDRNWLALSLVLVPIMILKGMHKVPEGHIGIYFRGGAILDTYTEPGWHSMLPVLDSFEAV